jgi:hypothetical protein
MKMKLITLSTFFALTSAKAIPTTTIDLNEILTASHKTPIGLPENSERLFCKNWILTGPDTKIISNGNDKPLYTNIEYGFSSLWSKKPVEKSIVSIDERNFTIDEFINMMSWNAIDSDGEITTSFIYLAYEWKFSNCFSYDYVMNRIKSRVTGKLTLSKYKPSEKDLIDAVDTTGCLDDSTCVKRLCFPVDPTNVYNYDESQIILYNSKTRMCYRYMGSFSDSYNDNQWYQITDAGIWD